MGKQGNNLLYEELSYKLRGCCFNVYNKLGFGHKEEIYQRALAEEFKISNIVFEKEKSLPIKYNDKQIGNYRPDFVIEDKIVLEIKAVEFMPKIFEGQLVRYLKATNYQLGFLINFGSTKLQIIRKIWTPEYRPHG